MGIDLLDIMFRIEKRFQVQVHPEDWMSMVRDPQSFDVTVGDLFKFIQSRRRLCRECEYDLRGHPSQSTCPECGFAFDFHGCSQQDDWTELVGLLASALNVEPNGITTDSWLVKDLGMT